MDTAPLFYDDEHHAIRAVVESGKGYKKTASHLWPAMKPESAYSKLKHAVNGAHGEHLKLGEVRALMVFNERFDVLLWLCDECSHSRPMPIAPRDEAAQLAKTIANASQVLNRAVEALERVQGRATFAGRTA